MLSILLVDDDDIIRATLRTAMEKHGHTVTEARNGEEGLSAALYRRFDVVVTDVQMPKMTGLTLFRRLHRERPGLAVVLMTSFGVIGDVVHAMREGATDYVTKPFDADTFVAGVLGKIDARVGTRA